MRQQPYEHLISTQNVCAQNTATCGTPSFAKNAQSTSPSANGLGGLSSLLGNAANLSKVGGLLGNMLKNTNQSAAQTQSGNTFSQNMGFGAPQTQKANNSTNYFQQNAQQNNIFSQSNAAAPLQSNTISGDPNDAQNIIQNFPTINPQYALETLLHPQPPIRSQAPRQAERPQNALQDNRNCVLRQMQLHNDYLLRIPHN